MKNKIALASAFVAASSLATAEIKINDFLSFEGFIDMSYSHLDTEIGDISDSDNNFGIDQVEIVWLFDFDKVTGQIDIAYEGSDNVRFGRGFSRDDDDIEVEQAFATYHFDNGGAITAGRYASMLGFEAFEPTGLYQFSYAYDFMPASDLGSGFSDATALPGYAQGVKFTHESDTTFFGISLQDEAYDFDNDRLGGDDSSSWAVEVAGAYYMENGLSFFLGGVFEEADEAEGDTWLINAYTTFETGAWIFAAEVNYGESESGRFGLSRLGGLGGSSVEEEEALQALIMANFAYSEQGSITGRLSYADHEEDDTSLEADFIKYTLAHNWAFTDNLALVTEVSYVDGELNDEDYESLIGALELIFSF